MKSGKRPVSLYNACSGLRFGVTASESLHFINLLLFFLLFSFYVYFFLSTFIVVNVFCSCHKYSFISSWPLLSPYYYQKNGGYFNTHLYWFLSDSERKLSASKISKYSWKTGCSWCDYWELRIILSNLLVQSFDFISKQGFTSPASENKPFSERL